MGVSFIEIEDAQNPSLFKSSLTDLGADQFYFQDKLKSCDRFSFNESTINQNLA